MSNFNDTFNKYKYCLTSKSSINISEENSSDNVYFTLLDSDTPIVFTRLQQPIDEARNNISPEVFDSKTTEELIEEAERQRICVQEQAAVADNIEQAVIKRLLQENALDDVVVYYGRIGRLHIEYEYPNQAVVAFYPLNKNGKEYKKPLVISGGWKHYNRLSENCKILLRDFKPLK